MVDRRSTPPGVKVDARIVPFPPAISGPARAFLESAVEPDGSIGPRPSLPSASDRQAWADYRDEQAKLFSGVSAGADARRSGATVETVEIAGVTVHHGVPGLLGREAETRAFIDIHGGAFVVGGGEPSRAGALMAAHRHKVRAYGVDYRMPPEVPFPGPLDDCLAVYRWVVDRYRPEDVVVCGASAGGNLAAALMLRARNEGMPLPAALVLLTPELDLTESGDSFAVNRSVDVVLRHGLADSISLYAAGHDLRDPYLSPLFGDFERGFPPTFLQAGTRDLFLSNAARMHRALRKAGVAAELHVFDGMPHGGFRGAPEDIELAAEVDRFVAAQWGRTPDQ